MIQGNITVEENLILKQPLKSYNGTVKYAKYDSEGNLLEDYPTDTDFTNFYVKNQWNTSSLKNAGIDNTNNEYCVESTSYGNGICIITFKNSRYIGQSTDYGDTWDLIDLGYVAKRTTTFINDAHYVVDYKRIYILSITDDRFRPIDKKDILSSSLELTVTYNATYNNMFVAPNNDASKFLVIQKYVLSSSSLKFTYKIVSNANDINLTTGYIDKDKESLGLSINSTLVIGYAKYDTNMKKFIVLLTAKYYICALIIDPNDASNISHVNIYTGVSGTAKVDMINTGSKQIIIERGSTDIYYGNNMSNFNVISLKDKLPEYNSGDRDNTFSHIRYVNNIYHIFFVRSEYVLISTDGINWKLSRELPFASSWQDIKYINNKYYIIDGQCNIVRTISDLTEKNNNLVGWNAANIIKEDETSYIMRYKGCVKCGNRYVIYADNYLLISDINTFDEWHRISMTNTGTSHGANYVNLDQIIAKTENGVEVPWICTGKYINTLKITGVKNSYLSNGNNALLGSDNIYKVDKVVCSENSINVSDISICEVGTQNLYRLKKDNTITKYTIPNVDSTTLTDSIMLKGKNIRVGGKAPLYEFTIKSGSVALGSLLSESKSSVLSSNITNPLLAFGVDNVVVLSKDSALRLAVNLKTNATSYSSSDSVLARDKPIDMIYTNGLFIALGATNYIYYSKDGISWNYKKISSKSTVANAIISGSVTYIPEKQRLLVINTSFKENSFIAKYENYLGLVSDLDDHNYKIDEIYDHVYDLTTQYGIEIK